MKITALGGGSEVGASCLHVELNGVRLLVDAGMRMHHHDPMPAVGMLEELGGIDAIVVTHAHADHIGALPFVQAMYPEAPIYATFPTIDLMRIMMKDSYRILEARCRLEQRLPPYTEEQMQQMLGKVLAFPSSGQLNIKGVEISLYRAGHILGAVMFGMVGGGERLLLTGDLSFRAGRTIPGAKVPYDFRPDVVVMESTYGNRAHVDRSMEEKRLAEHVAEVVAAGGFALVPAFALGRSQEILLILQDYMDKGLIPSFPIYVDGMVTPICRIYRSYPQYLKGPVAHRIRQNHDVFLTEGRCIAVRDVQHREQLLQGKPGAIVASSGMLIGGASQWYAERLIENSSNAIFITGYQDEESPGRKLLALAEGKEQTLELNGVIHQVACRVDKYALSAHADAMEMTRFIEQLAPAHTLLVHGDDDARSQLAQRLDHRFGPVLVDNGETYTFEPRASGKGSKGKKYRYGQAETGLEGWIGQVLLVRQTDGERLIYPVICTGVFGKTRTLNCQDLRKQRMVKIIVSEVVETLGMWAGSIQELEEILLGISKFSRPELERMNWGLLQDGHQYDLGEVCERLGAEDIGQRFAVALALLALPDRLISRVSNTDGSALPRYGIDDAALNALQTLQLGIQGLHMDMATALDTARELLQDHARFLRCGGEVNAGTVQPEIVLYFDFPDAVEPTERSEIAAVLERKTGWKVKFSPSVRQDLLVDVARALIGQNLNGNPSIMREKRQLVLDIRPSSDWDAVQRQFREMTGYTLQSKQAGDANAVIAAPAAVPCGGQQPMEANRAQQEVKLWAREIAATIYKAGMRTENGSIRMELHFISPQLAGRYTEEMKLLANRIGMPVSYTPNPKQNEIIAIAKELVPASWGVVKTPSIHMDLGVVRIKPGEGAAIDSIELAAIAEKLRILTGYELTI
ncbi:MBL fold metallo-hydrolase [Paenibacillaceae bacterium]|nr:MBL fold metallo-hydrolase [Paenibacillaceae bacterium]